MLYIQDIDFLEAINSTTEFSGGAQTQTYGIAQAGHGYAVANIGSYALGQSTFTNANTSTLVVQSPWGSISSAHAFGKASAYDDGSSSQSSARYGSFSYQRY